MAAKAAAKLTTPGKLIEVAGDVKFRSISNTELLEQIVKR